MQSAPPPARTVLVTGAAGFIGFHLARRLSAAGDRVLGVDNFSPYYDVALKDARAALLAGQANFAMARIDLEDRAALEAAWTGFAPDVVVHLAAQAGVRYSIEHPDAYVASNLVGTFNVLELARRHPPRHLLCASTSSVYGANPATPFRETDRAAHPLTFYAATKAAGELMGHSYAHLFRIPTTFFRFFTVYGPWGRPDMAPIKFAKAILEGRPIEIYNHGAMSRDFTYIDDLVEAVVRLIDVVPGAAPAVEHDSLSPAAPFRVVNIGQGAPVPLMDFVAALESALGRPARKTFLPMQPGEVQHTEAACDLLRRLTGFVPGTSLDDGCAAFAAWCRAHLTLAG